eukprot:4220059-Lingulodinium_polyedra.AAC.1
MSVPVLGSILAQELICLQDSLSARRLHKAIGRPACELGLPSPQIQGWSARHQAEEPEQVLPGVYAGTVAGATNIPKQRDRDIPGRAPRSPRSPMPEANAVFRKRQRQGDTPRSSSGCAAQGHGPAGQPGQDADTPVLSSDIQRVGNDLSESGGEDSPILDFAS